MPPFFVQNELSPLLAYKYFKPDTAKLSKEEQELRERYAYELDLAWYLVNVGTSREEFDNLTPMELAFIRKEFETRTVSVTTLMRNAMSNSLSNGFRKKGKAFVDLWSPTVSRTQKEQARNDIETIKAIEEAEKKQRKAGTTWVDLLYKNAGIKRKK